MPGIVKIGKTARGIETRLSELYSTGVPVPFECVFAGTVSDEEKIEKGRGRGRGHHNHNKKIKLTMDHWKPLKPETLKIPWKNNELKEITEMLIKPGVSCYSDTIMIK